MRSDDEHNAEEAGHESIAISANSVAKGFAVLFGVLVAALLLMAGLMFLLSKVFGGSATVKAPPEPASKPAGVPELDSNQRGNLRLLREREREVLAEYAWVDPNAGIARIPIKRAIEILAERGTLPAGPAVDPVTNPTPTGETKTNGQ
jgi:hypothetical protein